MTPEGALARTAHPRSIGSALTHPRITTDFAESQVEFISGVHRGVDECFDELLDLHAFVDACSTQAPNDVPDMRASDRRTMSRCPSFKSALGIGIMPHSGMPGPPCGPALRSTST